MFQECAPPIQGCQTACLQWFFGNAVGCVEATASNDIQDITFLGGALMWKYANVCGDRIRLKTFASVWYDSGNPMRGNPK